MAESVTQESSSHSNLLSLKWNNHLSNFKATMASLQEKSMLSDATLACEGQLFPVHKLVLSGCSEFFGRVFASTPCKHPVVVLHDLQPQHLHYLLSYMYVGEVNVPQSQLPTLIKAAETLQIKGLAAPDEEQPSQLPAAMERDEDCDYDKDSYGSKNISRHNTNRGSNLRTAKRGSNNDLTPTRSVKRSRKSSHGVLEEDGTTDFVNEIYDNVPNNDIWSKVHKESGITKCSHSSPLREVSSIVDNSYVEDENDGNIKKEKGVASELFKDVEVKEEEAEAGSVEDCNGGVEVWPAAGTPPHSACSSSQLETYRAGRMAGSGATTHLTITTQQTLRRLSSNPQSCNSAATAGVSSSASSNAASSNAASSSSLNASSLQMNAKLSQLLGRSSRGGGGGSATLLPPCRHSPPSTLKCMFSDVSSPNVNSPLYNGSDLGKTTEEGVDAASETVVTRSHELNFGEGGYGHILSMSPLGPHFSPIRQHMSPPGSHMSPPGTQRGPLHPRQWLCPYPLCGYATDRESWLKTHLRKHTGERPFRCPHCCYRSAQKSNLTVHVRKVHAEVVHTGVKPHTQEGNMRKAHAQKGTTAPLCDDSSYQQNSIFAANMADTAQQSSTVDPYLNYSSGNYYHANIDGNGN